MLKRSKIKMPSSKDLINRSFYIMLAVLLLLLLTPNIILADAEDIAEDIDNENELIDYVDYEDYEEIVELFYERQRGLEKEGKLKGQFEVLSYTTVGSGDSPYVKIKTKNKHSEKISSLMTVRKSTGHDNHVDFYEGHLTYHILDKVEKEKMKKKDKLYKDTLEKALELEKTLKDKDKLSAIIKVKDSIEDKLMNSVETGFLRLGRIREKFGKYGFLSKFTLDGVHFSKDLGKYTNVQLILAKMAHEEDEFVVMGGISGKPRKGIEIGIDTLHIDDQYYANRISGYSFYGEKKSKGLYIYGQYFNLINAGDGIYLIFKVDPIEKLRISNSFWRQADNYQDPDLLEPYSISSKVGGTINIAYELYKDTTISLKYRLNDTDPDDPGGKSRSGIAKFNFKPTKKSAFNVSYQRYITTTAITNSTIYGDFKYNFSKKTYFKLKVKFKDSDIDSDGDKTTETLVKLSRKINTRNRFYVEVRDKAQTGEEDEYKIKLHWKYLY